ncbi:hypothetical protein AB0L85_32870 [Streptomyces sp. NPDC052051]|uniref:hypothetical protein n=1 Tax=Streptomyces sp. NPDC052051 TaxID=3154649 RepID=UPI003416E3BC
MGDLISTWRELTGGNPEEIVLAVDFDATGRPEARFTDLAQRLGPDFTVWETAPQGMEAEAGPDGESYVKRWAEAARADGRTVRAVLGFCAGGVFAPFLADRIAEWQERPKLLLFDPETVTPMTMYWQFAKVVELAAPTLTAAELAEAQDAGRRAQEELRSLDALSAELLTIFRRVGELAFPRLGLDATSSGELMATFSSFIGYLGAAGSLDPLAGWRTATVLASTTPTSGLNGYRQIHPDAGQDLVAREIRVETEHGNLLGNDEVAKLAVELLTS